jgi:hypothetical protein
VGELPNDAANRFDGGVANIDQRMQCASSVTNAATSATVRIKHTAGLATANTRMFGISATLKK